MLIVHSGAHLRLSAIQRHTDVCPADLTAINIMHSIHAHAHCVCMLHIWPAACPCLSPRRPHILLPHAYVYVVLHTCLHLHMCVLFTSLPLQPLCHPPLSPWCQAWVRRAVRPRRGARASHLQRAWQQQGGTPSWTGEGRAGHACRRGHGCMLCFVACLHRGPLVVERDGVLSSTCADA